MWERLLSDHGLRTIRCAAARPLRAHSRRSLNRLLQSNQYSPPIFTVQDPGMVSSTDCIFKQSDRSRMDGAGASISCLELQVTVDAQNVLATWCRMPTACPSSWCSYERYALCILRVRQIQRWLIRNEIDGSDMSFDFFHSRISIICCNQSEIFHHHHPYHIWASLVHQTQNVSTEPHCPGCDQSCRCIRPLCPATRS